VENKPGYRRARERKLIHHLPWLNFFLDNACRKIHHRRQLANSLLKCFDMPAPDSLQRLARLYNLQTAYFDGLGQLREAPPEAILKVLQSLGAQAASMDDIPSALRARRQALWRRMIEPVTVAWQDRPFRLKLRLPVDLAEAMVVGEIHLEDGAAIDCAWRETKPSVPLAREIEGTRYAIRSLSLTISLPLGYHELHLRVGSLELQSQILSAPFRAYAPPGAAKRWGVFCPLYALRSARSWGAGDFSDLAEFAALVGALNGDAVGTLPMLAGFLDEPFNPSPYAPVSRLFWNEFYLDVESIPEFAECAAARALLESEEFRGELTAARTQPLVNYRRVATLKRAVIERLLAYLRSSSSPRRQEFEKFAAARPALRDYAAFRAKTEREQKIWWHWPEPDRGGALTGGGYDESAKLYHLYVQWLCDEQVGRLRGEHGSGSAALYLDFPLGVNRDSYDVWRYRDLFALDASGGAPPDGLFIKGQNWGFPPQHPGAVRRQGYRYYRECLRHHMTRASMLRIDHVMGLHRAFWVPDGFSAAEGLYVHQRAEEYYAVLNLESHRHHVQIVGENLGTVPDYVNQGLARHGILGMHVGQFGVGTAEAGRAVETPPANTVASLNTHDTATFMSFWTGADIDDRLDLGLIRPEQAEQERSYRAAQRAALLHNFGVAADDAAAVLRRWLEWLAEGPAEFLLINLEDLWLEILPQNVPGTWEERPNWRRKARFCLEEIRALPEFAGLLRRIGDIRRAIR
jgi:4-alpha-glucanotransferase